MASFKKYLFLLFFGTPFVFAQNQIGIISNDNNGTLSSNINPANSVDTNYGTYINLVGVAVDFNNSFVAWNAPFSLSALGLNTVPNKYKNPTLTKVIWKSNYFNIAEKNPKRNKINLLATGYAPSFTHQKGKWALGFLTKFRYINEIHDLAYNTGTFLVQGAKHPPLLIVLKTDNQGVLNSFFFNQYSFNLARRLRNDGEYSTKIGANFNYYSSNEFVNIQLDKASYTITPNPTDIKRVNINIKDLNASMIDASANSVINNGNFISEMLDFSGIGKGIGGDLGFVMEKRSDYRDFNSFRNGDLKLDLNNRSYKWKLSVSITDVGLMQFKSVNKNYTIANGNKLILPYSYPTFNGFQSFIDVSKNLFISNNTIKDLVFFMPTMIHIMFDYNQNTKWNHHFYLQSPVNLNKKVGPRQSLAMYYTPRIEKKQISYSFPIGITNNVQNLNIGFAVRAYGFYLGSDNVLGFSKIGQPKNLSIYTGMFVYLKHKQKRLTNKCP